MSLRKTVISLILSISIMTALYPNVNERREQTKPTKHDQSIINENASNIERMNIILHKWLKVRILSYNDSETLWDISKMNSNDIRSFLSDLQKQNYITQIVNSKTIKTFVIK